MQTHSPRIPLCIPGFTQQFSIISKCTRGARRTAGEAHSAARAAEQRTINHQVACRVNQRGSTTAQHLARSEAGLEKRFGSGDGEREQSGQVQRWMGGIWAFAEGGPLDKGGLGDCGEQSQAGYESRCGGAMRTRRGLARASAAAIQQAAGQLRAAQHPAASKSKRGQRGKGCKCCWV